MISTVVNTAAVFLIIWWLVLFVTLPFGVRGQAEEDSVVGGSEPGAPVDSGMWRKVRVTTAVSVVLTALFFLAVARGWMSWENWPFLPELPEGYRD